MDDILSEFISHTNADPALAHDLLEATGWELEAALSAFEGLQDTHAVLPDDEFDFDPNIELLSGVSKSDMKDLEAQEHAEEIEMGKEDHKKRQRERRARGLSFVAEDVVDNFRKVAVSKERVNLEEQVMIDDQFFRHSFVYPDFSLEPEDLQEFIVADLVDVSHRNALERSGQLNWWTTTGKLPSLEPLATSGDGNCLLHAASLYMWGFHDRELILRTALHRVLTTAIERKEIHQRWKYQTQIRNDEAGGLTFSDNEWEFEWSEIVRIATNHPRRRPTTASLRKYSSLRLRYESLEEVHVFALAHVLRRPIIVIANRVLRDISGEDLAPIYFSGIYLPLGINPTACYKSPVVLAYDASHFSPLVARQEQQQQPQSQYARMSGRKDVVIPLVTPDGALLPVQFVIDPEKRAVEEKWAKQGFTQGEFPQDIIRLLESYLQVRWIQLNVPTKQQEPETRNDDSDDYDHLFPVRLPKVRFPAACITHEPQPIYQKELIEKYLENARERFSDEKKERTKREKEAKRLKAVPCEGKECTMFGTLATNNLCSVCYEKSQVKTSEKTNETMEEKGHHPGLEDQCPSPKIPDCPPPYSEVKDPPVQTTVDSLNMQTVKAVSSTSQGSTNKVGSKPAWIKLIPSGLLPSKKSSSGGYARDSIQPIGFDLHQTPITGKKRSKCPNAGCKFYGSEETDGYCSKCFKELGLSTVV